MTELIGCFRIAKIGNRNTTPTSVPPFRYKKGERTAALERTRAHCRSFGYESPEYCIKEYRNIRPIGQLTCEPDAPEIQPEAEC